MSSTKAKMELDIRRFLRSKGDSWGPDSTVRINLEVERRKPFKDHRGKQRPKSARIEAYVSLRDCSDSIQLDFSASGKQRYMIKQRAVLTRLIADLQRLDETYGQAIIDLRDEGYLT
jgi:hypothetical protein